MQNRVKELVENLGLHPHPEGGFYKEVYRSETMLDGMNRNLLTSIYFLISAGNFSRFHRIKSDECWYFHEGDALRIHSISKDGSHSFVDLGTNIPSELPFHVVPAGTIFGSLLKEEKGYALVSCAVSPGFSFEDFELFQQDELVTKYPQHRAIIERLT